MNRENQKKIDEADPYGTRQIHKQLLPILTEIDALCRQYGIKYSLSGGSLLGAVRHHGFIPWDDDADIMFDRENYTRFLEVIAEHLPDYLQLHEDFRVKKVGYKEKTESAEDITVDLFVFDNIPDEPLTAKIKMYVILLLQGMMKKHSDYKRFSPKERVLLFITWLIGRLFTTKAKNRMYEKVSKWGNKKTTAKVNVYNTFFHQVKGLKYNREMLDAYIDVKFEDQDFMAIAEYDHYLTVLYGDYMQLPPEDKRRPSYAIEG